MLAAGQDSTTANHTTQATLYLPSVTWPSPASATEPPLRTARMVVPCMVASAANARRGGARMRDARNSERADCRAKFIGSALESFRCFWALPSVSNSLSFRTRDRGFPSAAMSANSETAPHWAPVGTLNATTLPAADVARAVAAIRTQMPWLAVDERDELAMRACVGAAAQVAPGTCGTRPESPTVGAGVVAGRAADTWRAQACSCRCAVSTSLRCRRWPVRWNSAGPNQARARRAKSSSSRRQRRSRKAARRRPRRRPRRARARRPTARPRA